MEKASNILIMLVQCGESETCEQIQNQGRNYLCELQKKFYDYNSLEQGNTIKGGGKTCINSR